MKWIFLLFGIFCLSCQAVFSQYSSKNNYTGNWETPASWIPTWNTPQTSISSYDIVINGYITVNGSLSFTGVSHYMIVNDTLVILGDLSLSNNQNVSIYSNGIIIVRGNLILNNSATIYTNGYLVVTGDVIKNGSVYLGWLISNNDPEKVFIGGAVSPATITDNNFFYPALDCTAPSTLRYSNSDCGYGNMTDYMNDPLYPFFLTTCPIAIPTITASGPITFCAGGSVTLTSSTGTTYLWSNGATTQSISVTASGSYTVKVTNESGCQSAASITKAVTVNVLPATPTITANGPTTFCDGGSVMLTSSSGISYLWSNGATTQSISVTASGSYTVKVTNASGCQSAASVAAIVTVNALPATPTITAGGPIIFCAGGSVTLTSAAGNSYLWSNGETTQIINATTSGSYAVQVKNTSGCQSEMSTAMVVTVNALPETPTITVSGPTIFCDGNSVTLTSSTAASYLWSTGEITQGINVTQSGSYATQVTNVSGCKSKVSEAMIVTVNPLPMADANSNSPICVGDAINLTSSGGASYIWNGPEGFTSAEQNPLIPDATSSMSGRYMVTATSLDGCTDVATLSILVNEYPLANAGPDQELGYINSTQMQAVLTGPEAGEWSLISGSGNILDLHSPTTSITGLSKGENIFSWKVQNGNCEASEEVKLIVIELFIPSVITPNGDGKNDYFKISEIIGQVELIIFNRWGNYEYTNDNYLNDWDGRNNKGSELPDDTYFYILKFENGKIKKGTILIKR